MCVPLNSQATYVPRNGELPFHIPGAPSRFPVSAFIVTSELVGRADIRHKPVATETPGRGAGPWPASIAGLGAGARRGHAQLQLPAHSRNKTRGGLPRSPRLRGHYGWDKRGHRNKRNCKHSTSAGDVPWRRRRGPGRCAVCVGWTR